LLGLIKARHPELDRYTPPSTRPAVLAYFGWPQAHEDAGLAIAGAVRHVSNPGGEPLAARIGIATGPVMVGELIGEGAAQEEAVVG
jgi:class 3 adenylate cyclase